MITVIGLMVLIKWVFVALAGIAVVLNLGYIAAILLLAAFFGFVVVVENRLRVAWNVPQKGRWKTPVSNLWGVISAFEGIFLFFYSIVVALGEAPFYGVVISLAIYGILSYFTLKRAHKKWAKRGR